MDSQNKQSKEKLSPRKKLLVSMAAAVIIAAGIYGLSKEGDAAKNIPFNEQLLDALKNPDQIELTYADVNQLSGSFELEPGAAIYFSPQNRDGEAASSNLYGETEAGMRVVNPILFDSPLDSNKYVGFVIEEESGAPFMGYVDDSAVQNLDTTAQIEFNGHIRPVLEQE
jgi:hypothetical protein